MLALPRVLRMLLLLKQIIRIHESYSIGTKYFSTFEAFLEMEQSESKLDEAIIKLSAGFDYIRRNITSGPRNKRPTREYFSIDHSRIDYYYYYYYFLFNSVLLFITSKGILEKIADEAVSGYEICAQIELSFSDCNSIRSRSPYRYYREKNIGIVRFVAFLSLSLSLSFASSSSLFVRFSNHGGMALKIYITSFVCAAVFLMR